MTSRKGAKALRRDKTMKTKFDLYKSASDAAATTLELEPFETAAAEMKAFSDASHDPKDWEFFHQVFAERREFFVNLKGQKAPSAPPEAAKAAAGAE